MQLIFTSYNCGTGYNRHSNDVVGQLYWETVTNCCVTDGVGGGGPQGNAGGAWKISGLLGGVGVDANVGFVVNEVASRCSAGNQNMVVNMLGWSRGAMTCIKIANALNADTVTRTIPVNIFAIDPVPGRLMHQQSHVAQHPDDAEYPHVQRSAFAARPAEFVRAVLSGSAGSVYGRRYHAGRSQHDC